MGSCSLNRFVIFHKNVIMRITEKANIYAFILPALVIPANTIASQKYVALRMSRQMCKSTPSKGWSTSHSHCRPSNWSSRVLTTLYGWWTTELSCCFLQSVITKAHVKISHTQSCQSKAD